MKKRALRRVFQWRGGRDSNPRLRFKPQHSLSRRAQSATLAPPQVQLFYFTRIIRSGGSGIRTHVGVTQTCFQDMRLRPLGHPSIRSRRFSGGGRNFTIRQMSLRATRLRGALSFLLAPSLRQNCRRMVVELKSTWS